MKQIVSIVQTAIMRAREQEWHLLVAVSAIVFVFIAIMTGHVAIKY